MVTRSLQDLTEHFPHLTVRGNADTYFSHITNRYQDCREGSLYVALRGSHMDGTRFIQQAAELGACAVLHENLSSGECMIPSVRTDDARRDMSQISAWLYQTAQASPFVIGVTGTDGKTTTCYFIYQLLRAAGFYTALLSTVYIDDGTGLQEQRSRLTTPEAPHMHAFLHTAFTQGAAYAVIEASSHALSLKTRRLADVLFDAAVLTTLTSEHLDFHGSRSEYVADKRRLFAQLRRTCSPALIPQDLDFELPDTLDGVSYYSSTASGCSLDGMHVTYTSSFDQQVIRHDLAAACAVLSSLKLPLPTELGFLQLPKGRFHQCRRNGRLCIIDFAHTPDAFEKLYAYVEAHYPESRILTLFGSAGERDRHKRAPMGKLAAIHSQLVCITSEDPRSEGAYRIYQDICADLSSDELNRTLWVENREQAIREVVMRSRQGDVLLFLGKGHEKSIEIDGNSYPWDEFGAVESSFREVSRI